ncbi:ATP-dependent RNA helicase DDX46/PRP5 [Babesia microti strain RI]|uniref:RNA helicase n=1 Tax=Babesia microti (strain RI) TaxID=1133968 RepID=A0A1N6LWN4_BABMR|nr:ATP-dependent RNA helicase DDX46/PRP5 [Babesia microti strain RI]SIO73287.1 ATP-dependent RNA helicase DDX46/PRP5 [Babesia microti strain RI]|eukprot:XP_021337391.1 ATP-dependent RNA helicase DDX46/PRP5 [Babesia microti strain RI]
MSSDSRSSKTYSDTDSGSDIDRRHSHRNHSYNPSYGSSHNHGQSKSGRSRSHSKGHSRHRRSHRHRDHRHRSRSHSRHGRRSHGSRDRDRDKGHKSRRHKSRSRTRHHRDRSLSLDHHSSRPDSSKSSSHLSKYRDSERYKHSDRDRYRDEGNDRDRYKSGPKDDIRKEDSVSDTNQNYIIGDSQSSELLAKRARLAKFQQLQLEMTVEPSVETSDVKVPEKKRIWSRVKSFFSRKDGDSGDANEMTNADACENNIDTDESINISKFESLRIIDNKSLHNSNEKTLQYVCDDEQLLKDFEIAAKEDEEDPLDAYMATLNIPESTKPKQVSVSWEDIQCMIANNVVEDDKSRHNQPVPQSPRCNTQAAVQIDTTGVGDQHSAQVTDDSGIGNSIADEKINENVDPGEDLFIKMLKRPLDEDKLDKSDDEDDKKIIEIHKQSKVQFYTEIAGKVRAQKKLEPMDPAIAAALPAFQKDFYVECKEIASLADHEISSIRKTNGNIKVRGKGCPRPIINFAQCGLPDEVLKILEKRDYENPFPVQMQCIPVIMSGRDLVGVAQTGSGKTLAYLLPLVRHVMAQPKLLIGDGCIALVIVPTRELAVQVNREAMKFAKPVKLVSTAVYGGAGIGDQLNALKRGSHIVVGTPGRLIDVLTISNGKVTNLKRTTFVVLDEADRMFDLGFAPQVQAIIDNTRPDRQTCLFSATFPSAIEMLAKRILTNPVEVTVGKKGAGANKVEQHVLVVKDEKEKLFKLLKLLGEWYEHGKIIIFVNKQVEADNLFVTLLKYGYHSYTLHGGQDQTDRTFTLQDFKDPRIRNGILISTSVASRGLDVKQVVLVINYNTPGHLEDYIHRVGRTGRAGNVGVAYTLVLPSDAPKTPDIVKALEYSNQPVPHQLQSLCDAHLLATETITSIPMKTDKSNNISAEVKRRKPKLSGGFGGKGYKFDQSEMSLQQRQRKEATKVVDEEVTEEENARLEEDMTIDAPEPPRSVKPTPQPKHYNSGPDPTMLYLNANASTGGIIVDEFQINKYSEAVRSKVTNRDVLLRISEDTGTRLQVKGHFLNPSAQNTIVYSGFVTSTFGLKPLYVEINGPSPLHIQRAKVELKNLIDAINETTPPTIPQFRTPGKYSVL